MMKRCYINEDGSIDLTNFNLLNESEQVSVMSTWNQEQIIKEEYKRLGWM